MIETKSAGGMVQNTAGLILVVSQHGTSWSLPKGHIEHGEEKIAAARREIYEETGIRQLEFIQELGNYWRYKIGKDGGEDTTERKTIFMYHFRTKEQVLLPVDRENPEAKWVLKEEVTALLTAKKDREFFLAVLDKIS